MKLNAREAARLLAMPESELYAMVDARTIPCHLVNKQPLFSEVELLEWSTAQGRPLAEVLFPEVAAPDLGAAIAGGGVHHDVPGGTLEVALPAIIERLPIDAPDRELVLAILLARPTEVATSVGDGVAIPSVRTPLVFSDRPPALAVCFLAEPVTIDGASIHTMFALIAPTIDVHLQMLSRLGIALHHPSFRDAIERRAELADVLQGATATRATEDRS